jgi:hypothetical protein
VPSILESYWLGVLDRLQAEVDILSRLVDHAGEMGRENEVALQRILERLLPRKYGIGTGLLIDSKGGYSKQMDIVIHDQDMHPAFFSQTTTLLYPHEVVYGVIEVKTNLRKRDIDDIKRKCRSIRELYLQQETIIAPNSGEGHWTVVKRTSAYPKVSAVAYSTDMTPKTVVQHFVDAEEIERPDLLCILTAGLLGGIATAAPGVERFPAGLVVLQPTDADGNRLPLAVFDSSEQGLSESMYNRRMYPVVSRGGDRALVEPARALLLFLTSLLEVLADRQLSPSPLARRYLSEHFNWLEPTQSPGQSG